VALRAHPLANLVAPGCVLAKSGERLKLSELYLKTLGTEASQGNSQGHLVRQGQGSPLTFLSQDRRIDSLFSTFKRDLDTATTLMELHRH
jgi:hypothetical protein